MKSVSGSVPRVKDNIGAFKEIIEVIKATHFVLMELDGTSLRLAFGLRLLPVLILSGRVAPLTRGSGYGAWLRPGGDGGRRWCRWRRYRDIGKGTQAGRGRAQGHRTRRRRQWKEGRRWTVCLTRLLTEIVAFFTVESSINQLTSVRCQFMSSS